MDADLSVLYVYFAKRINIPVGLLSHREVGLVCKKSKPPIQSPNIKTMPQHCHQPKCYTPMSSCDETTACYKNKHFFLWQSFLFSPPKSGWLSKKPLATAVTSTGKSGGRKKNRQIKKKKKTHPGRTLKTIRDVTHPWCNISTLLQWYCSDVICRW